MSTLFISYSTKDRATAEIFYGKLIEMGFEPPFRDDHPDSGIPAGAQWERELYRKLRLCKALVVLVSRNWLDSKWCFAELAYAKAQGKEFFPILIDDSPDVPSVVAERQGVRFSDPDIWQRLRRGLVEADLAPENDFPWPVTGVDECPYPGLEPFEAHHAGVYFGRDDEILELREQLNQMTDKGEPRLLYVVGASGSGKSSLVKAGLLPRLTRKESSRWCVLPTFRWNELRAKGRDWPEQLAMCLHGVWPSEMDSKPDWRTLRERYLVPPLLKEQKKDESEVAKYKAAITSAADSFIDDMKDLLVARDDPNATPLLIIDQFEELLSAAYDDTVAPFLDFLGCLMSSRRSPLHCIATVRTDFLAAIQTRAELIAWKDHTGVYSLPLMKPDRFYDVIRHPAEKVGITFESDALVDRMVKDTGTNDALPLLAFTLRELYEQHGDDKRFTFDEYDRKLGGLEGCLTEVANELLTEPVELDGVSDDERERQLHLAFSNHLVRINDKDQFVRRTALWSELPEQVRPLLQRFIDRRLITSRLRDENDSKSERVVEVAHEALFRRWDRLASWLDGRRDLLRWRVDVERSRTASGDKWGGLTLSQLAVANELVATRKEELREDERYWIQDANQREAWRRRRLIATASVFAILFFVAALALVQTNIAKRETETARVATTAVAIMAGLRGEGESPTQDEYESLSLLADSEPAVRVAFMEHLLSSPEKAERLQSRYPYVLHAVVGLDRQHKEWLQRLLQEHGQDPKTKPLAINVACAEFGSLLHVDASEFNVRVASNYLAAMEKTPATDQLSSLGSALGSLGGRLPAEQATAGAQQILAAMEKTTDPGNLSSLGSALGSLGEQLPAEQATALAPRILAAMKKTTSPRPSASLGRALGSLGEHLSAEQAAAIAQQILAAMEKTTNPYQLTDLGSALGSLGKKVPAERAAAGAQQILTAMEKTAHARDLSFLGSALGSLVVKLPAEQAAAMAQQILAAMEKTTDPGNLSSLGSALGSFGEQLPAEQAAVLAPRILAAMEKTTDPYQLSSLGRALGSFGVKLTADQAAAGAQQMTAAMEETSDPYQLSSLARALGSLGEQLPAEQAAAGAQQILTAMEKTAFPGNLSVLGSALGSLGEQLSAAQAAAGAQQILAAVEKTTNPEMLLPSAGSALGSLSEQLSAEEAAALAPQILAVMEKPALPGNLSSLGSALGSLGGQLSAEQAAILAQQILAAMEKPLYPANWSSLSTALGSLGEHLSAEQAAAIAQQILAAMEKTIDLNQLSSLGSALGSFGEKLPAEQAAAGAQQILAAVEKMTKPDHVSSLSSALGTLAVHMETPATFAVLKSLACVGDTQAKVLAGLEKKAGEKFDGNIWKTVQWAELQGIDVQNISRWPVRQRE